MTARSRRWALTSAVGVLGGLATGGSVPVPRVERITGRLVELMVATEAVRTTVGVRVSLPRGWRAGRSGRWPVLYLLHGCCQRLGYRVWSEAVDLAEIPELADVLVVMPEGGSVGFYSDWLDGPGWETFHLRELPSLVAEWLGADERAAVAGNSMGGFGALSYAARFPGRFRAVASFSGVTHTLEPEGGPELLAGLVAGWGPRLDRLWGPLTSHREIWVRHNPFDLVNGLSGLAVYLASGDGRPGPMDRPTRRVDQLERVLGRQNAAFAARLREVVPTATVNLYGPGTHGWPYWDRELRAALPLLRSALD